MKIDYTQSWNRAIALLVAHKEALLAIAGVFIFLPTLLVAEFVGEPAVEGLTDTAEIQAVTFQFIADNWLPFFLSNLLIAFGGICLYILLSPSHRGTVGDALSQGIRLFFVFFLANIFIAIILLFGFIMLIIPGLYLFGRLALVPMIIADEAERNPLAAIKKGWGLTKSNGWSIFLFFAVVAMVGGVTILVVGMVIGVVTGLVSGGQGISLVENLISSLLGTGFQIILIALAASVYRELTGQAVDVKEIFS